MQRGAQTNKYKQPLTLREKTYITTVTLIKPKEGDKERHVFFCPDCRNAIIEYIGEVVSIVPGRIPQDLPITVPCRNYKCRRKYTFNYFAEKEQDD
jgi:hypothetical protein